MRGKIIRGIGGFYYVHDGQSRVYECRARGVFRNRNIRPLVGDDVEMDVLDAEKAEGNITRVLPRKNELGRPAVANVDQAILVFSVRAPAPNLNLLDRFLVMTECQDLPAVLVFNKRDLAEAGELAEIEAVYRPAGYPLLFVSAAGGAGMESVREILRGRTTVLAGPSGVGKSSLLNRLIPEAGMETGEVSAKIQRGRHTTRRSELFCMEEDTFLMDTPGFTALDIFEKDENRLQDCYPEFGPFREECRFLNCVHVGERDCGVKAAVERGMISRVRYGNYLQMYREIRETRKY